MAGPDASMLDRALQLAARGTRATAPNPRVGAVVVADGRIVGEGWHERAGEAHAEVRALEAAGAGARGATLYTSLEPCSHRGKTPPCTEAIVSAGIRRVDVALIDPDPLVRGGGVATLREAGVDVSVAEGEIAARARRVVEEYFVHRTEGRSFAAIKVAGTLDGKIADRDSRSSYVTGDLARSHGRALRERFGAVLVGAGTVLADDPELLPPRGPGGGRFVRVVLDRRLRTPPDARLLRTADAAMRPVLLFAAPDAGDDRRAALERAGAEIVTPGTAGSSVPPIDVLRELARRDVLGVVVEGGGGVHAAFLAAGLIDKLYWYLSATILGDPEAVPAVRGGPRALEDAWRASIAKIDRLGDDALLTLYPKGKAGGCSPDS